jgi:hypothetical protein
MISTVVDSFCALSATPAYPFPLPSTMKCHLSLRRHKGQRLAADKGDIRQRLVDFRLTAADGYRVARAQCCAGGSEVAVLWEPTLIRVDADAFLFQGFEKVDEQTVAQEWIVKPYAAGARP